MRQSCIFRKPVLQFINRHFVCTGCTLVILVVKRFTPSLFVQLLWPLLTSYDLSRIVANTIAIFLADHEISQGNVHVLHLGSARFTTSTYKRLYGFLVYSPITSRVGLISGFCASDQNFRHRLPSNPISR